MNRRSLALAAIFTFSGLLFASCLSAQSQPKTRNVVLIVADGLRWQEVFTGADPLLITNPDYVRDTGLTRQMYPAPA